MKIRPALRLLFCASALWLVAKPAPCPAAENRSATTEIAAIYFPGFHQDDHYDSWFGEGWNEWRLLNDAKTWFPGQRLLHPANGSFDEADPKVMARQIDLAADHGINVFVFDWYWYSGVKILHRPLEEGFLKAPNNNRLKFALMWANHDWKNYFPAPKDREPTLWLPSRMTPNDFARLMNYCADHYFCRSNYWRPGGGLYFSLFEAERFLKDLGGVAATKKVLQEARQRIQSRGLGNLHFGAFLGAPEATRDFHEAGFDSVTTYNLTASGKASDPAKPLDNYSDLVDSHASFWKSMDTGILPYIPVLTIGWDTTPRWEKDAPFPPQRPAYPYGTIVVSNTPAEFSRLCKLAREYVENAKIKPPAVLINAWNEWTEGSALVPSTAFGDGYLNAVKKDLTPIHPQ